MGGGGGGGGGERREPAGGQLQLPPGFRFYPSDEELVVHYLCKRASSQPFPIPIIAEIDLYKFDPWELPGKALFGEKEWYFFSPRDRKYPNGSRPNRAAGSGYWKATGTDKPINVKSGHKVGVKKALVFYKGRPPKGDKTNWIMHEYRLADSAAKAARRKGSIRLDDWVLCRIYKKLPSASRLAMQKEDAASEEANDFEEGQEMEEDSKMGITFNTTSLIENSKPLIRSINHTYFDNYTSSQNQSQSQKGPQFQSGSMFLDNNLSNKPFIKPPHMNMNERIYKPSSFDSAEPSVYTSSIVSNQSSSSSSMYTDPSINSSHQHTTSSTYNPSTLSNKVLTSNLVNIGRPLLMLPNFRVGTHDSPVNSSVDEERGLPTTEILSENPSNTNQGGDTMPLFNFDALPSPFGRLDQNFSF